MKLWDMSLLTLQIASRTIEYARPTRSKWLRRKKEDNITCICICNPIWVSIWGNLIEHPGILHTRPRAEDFWRWSGFFSGLVDEDFVLIRNSALHIACFECKISLNKARPPIHTFQGASRYTLYIQHYVYIRWFGLMLFVRANSRRETCTRSYGHI